MENINIRLAKISDKEFIQKIHKQSKKEIGGFNLFYSWDNYCSKKTSYLYYIIEDNKTNVGFVRFGFSKKLDLNVIKEIAIDIEHRGKGYGKKLIEKLPKPIYLTCNEDNNTGNIFYKYLGFRSAGKLRLKNGKLSNIWILKQ